MIIGFNIIMKILVDFMAIMPYVKTKHVLKSDLTKLFNIKYLIHQI